MCKNWIEIGVCRYGNKCQFAHGDQELLEKTQPTNAKYKSKICTTFQERLYCPYGKRCLFRHEDRVLEEIRIFDRIYDIVFFPHNFENLLELTCKDESEMLLSQNDRVAQENNIKSPSKNMNQEPKRLKIFQIISNEADTIASDEMLN